MSDPMTQPLDLFIPYPDVQERHSVVVNAPADLVYETATRFDLYSVPAVRWIFWLRGKLLRAETSRREPRGLVEEMRSLGWGSLTERPGELVVSGAATEPWVPNPTFRAIPPDEFASFAEPYQVKIAWTLETRPLSAASTRLATETRAVATDGDARKRFMNYWRWARFGILSIRWFLLPAVRRRAEARWRDSRGT